MHWQEVVIDDDVYTYDYFLQDDVCRLCWNRNAVTDLFQEFIENDEETLVADVIKDFLDIDLSNMNPSKLCESCCNEIKRFYSYKKFCRESDEKLREILSKGPYELKIKELDLISVKDEVIDEDFDKSDDFLDETTAYEPEIEKAIITHSKFRKKYSQRRSSTSCDICCIDLKSKEVLSAHNSELHGIENGGTQFKCYGCEKRFKSKKRRLSHEVNFCKGLKDGYKCNFCDRYLPKRCIYERHLRDHRHNTLTELPEHLFKCSKCEKRFKTNELLNAHVLSEHSKEKKYVCDVCGRIFSRQDYLYKHKFTHTGVKRHQCPHCDFKATQRSSLTMHIRKHTGERPYTCDICPQRCISSSNLRAHRRRHLGVKKFECAICNKKFGYKISLEEHISSTHVRSETHPCQHCNATYARVRGLKRHLASKHGVQVKNKTDENILVQVTEDCNKMNEIKNVEYELKDTDNVLLLKHQDGDVYMV
ncbi:uncharacterized protein LOC142985290 [Anticarsia gemmatalis]|uniref:uncharacterized protein LOC142985290 n=1 Tax=Anticarsia gemmatalis TaxID=129554 RepID=UPI003F7731D1